MATARGAEFETRDGKMFPKKDGHSEKIAHDANDDILLASGVLGRATAYEHSAFVRMRTPEWHESSSDKRMAKMRERMSKPRATWLPEIEKRIRAFVGLPPKEAS